MRANVKAAFLRCLYASTWRGCINIILTHSGKEMIDDRKGTYIFYEFKHERNLIASDNRINM